MLSGIYAFFSFMAILSAYKISKSYPRKTVLDEVSLSFEGGRIYALLGENGAGKTTLASVLIGSLRPDSGKLLLDGAEIDRSPAEVCRIAAVNQIPELVDGVSVLDNCILGAEPAGHSGIIRRGAARKELESLCRQWNTGEILNKKTFNLTAQERFYAAFLSALYRNPDFLILDEPSATLSGNERASLFESLSEAARDGLCVIFITHDIKEAVRYSDAVYVLRDGIVSARYEADELKKADEDGCVKKIYSAMFGEAASAGTSSTVSNNITDSSKVPLSDARGDEILQFDGVSAAPYRKASLYDVSFAVQSGVITCITGQKEAGLETLEDIVTGMNEYPVSGEISLMGAPCKRLTPSMLRELGAGIVPSDKTHRASSPLLSVRDILTARYGKETSIIDASGVDILPDEPVVNLSGGMLQSLVIERELYKEQDADGSHEAPGVHASSGHFTGGQKKIPLLIFANPVYGLDRRRTSAILHRIKSEAQKGAAVLVLSTEGSEVEKIADIKYKLVSGVLEKAEAAAHDRVKPEIITSGEPERTGKRELLASKKRTFNLHPLYALVSGFVAAAVLILIMAKNPWQTLLSFFAAPVSSAFFAGNWLNTATLLLAAAVGAYSSITAGSINLGGEGQVYAGGFVAALALGYLPELPAAAAVPILIIVAAFSAAAGAAMMAVPAVLKTRRNIEVLLSSFLLSGAVIPCIDSAITNVFRAKNGNLLATPFLNECFRLPHILKPSSLNISVFVVLALAAFLLYILVKTKKGRVFRITGTAPVFAKLSGFNVRRNFTCGMLLSGALHGLCGFFAVTGTHFTCHSGFYSGFGWNALTAALIADKKPLMLIPSVLVLSFIYTGCEKTVLTGSMNPDMTFIIQAVILLFVTVRGNK
ncbi:MAG: ATP-binding cassette domain-containing protein [Spirochaetaceae bacterium]|nr:ATP-binding cassette domain-containing protein [Spirochaetaceae bacterium]